MSPEYLQLVKDAHTIISDTLAPAVITLAAVIVVAGLVHTLSLRNEKFIDLKVFVGGIGILAVLGALWYGFGTIDKTYEAYLGDTGAVAGTITAVNVRNTAADSELKSVEMQLDAHPEDPTLLATSFEVDALPEVGDQIIADVSVILFDENDGHLYVCIENWWYADNRPIADD